MKFKNAKIECVGSFKTFDRESQEAVLECCKGDDFDYEEPPTTEYNDTTEVPPAPLMSSQILRMGCDDHNICGNDEECFERDGNVDCRCKSGFENFEGKCHDKDECRMGLHNCTKIHKACVNTHGSFLCDKCLDGYEITAFPYDYYESEDLICVDIDECARKSHKCSPDQKCENIEGNYRCVNECAKGFHRVRGECVDIDECETKNPCHFECKNIPGSFECVCPDGYYLDDAGKCTDINECWRTPCGADEVCTNVHGSYRCENISCPTYYKPQEDSK